MGAGLAVMALGQVGVSDRARLVLARMALVAMDSDNPPVYWAGWEALARYALGYRTYDRTAKQAVARAVRELLERGLIKSERPASPGRNVEYTLHIPVD